MTKANSRIQALDHPLSKIGRPEYVRINQICGDLIPIGQSTWWRWVAKGWAPQPIRLSPGCTIWRVEDIRALLERDWPRQAGAAIRRQGTE
jgi:predicted DNA-binding transcriptional regulator AlpA